MEKLKNKQMAFVDEYLIDLNATQAAIRAGYSEKSAGKQGWRLLNNVLVQAAFKERMHDREKRTEITQDRILKELANVAFANGTDYVRISENDLGAAEVDFIPTDTLPDDKKSAVAGIKKMQSGIEVKLYDKMKALELLGKHLGIFVDKNEDKNRDVNVVINGDVKEWAE